MELDHIAVSGATLEEAAEVVEAALGVVMQPGGRHDVFGTHNRLLGLADGLYLEAIAIDPSAPRPARPRWFDLDNFSGAARLTNWICRTEDLERTLKLVSARGGSPVELKRGTLRWAMAVPADGHLPFDNLFPALIQWHSPVHPSVLLSGSGCALHRLIVAHPDAMALRATLVAGHLNDHRLVIEPGPAALMAEIDTPGGRRVLQ